MKHDKESAERLGARWRSHPRVSLLVVAAVAVVATASVTLTGLLSGDTASPPAYSAPKAAAPGTRPPTCISSQLRVGVGPPAEPISGEQDVLFAVTNRGTGQCSLVGYPEVRLHDGRGLELPFKYVGNQVMYVSHRAPEPVFLAPDHRAYFLVAKYRCDIGSGPQAASATVRLPGVHGTFTAPAMGKWGFERLFYCKGGPDDPGQRVGVSPISVSPAGASAP